MRSPRLTPQASPDPSPGRGQIPLAPRSPSTHAVDGELANPKRPVISSYEAVGAVGAPGDLRSGREAPDRHDNPDDPLTAGGVFR
ncbi:hypothetical protein [Burkholderia sp. BE17]|uniref:hypothetical protein n=1 Tax=Burkholderia sp. BE17 TaxID=2656644 RepID=UPI00128D7825|nr:hypothetical protein [Burkholderia sp. BE17]MPV66733.1 hypothetical protein [Burkholderia sp. BE17]